MYVKIEVKCHPSNHKICTDNFSSNLTNSSTGNLRCSSAMFYVTDNVHSQNAMFYVTCFTFYVTANVHPQNAMQMVRALSEAQILFKSNVSTNQRRIQDFPDGESPSAQFGVQAYYFGKFFPKLHENEKNYWTTCPLANRRGSANANCLFFP